MREYDLIVGGGEAWEITRAIDGGRQVSIRLVAGAGSEARTNDVPASFVQGRMLYRRVGALEDVDAKRAGVEVARYVDLARCSHHPRLWVEEFHKKYPPGTRVPDGTLLLGWFSRLIEAGAARSRAEKRAKRPAKRVAAKHPIKKTPTKKRVAKK